MKKVKKKSGPQFIQSFKKLNKLQKFILILLLISLTFSSFPIVLVLLIGLLPTITVMITDRQNYDKQMIVGCFNIAGVFTYLFNVLGNFSLGHAFFLVSNIFNLILMLGSAALGMILYSEVPSLYVYLRRSSNQRRIEKINSRLEKLSEDWGVETAQNNAAAPAASAPAK